MKGEIKNAIRKGEEVAARYNPETLIPFPFKRISDDVDDLAFYLANFGNVEKDKGFSISGYILFHSDVQKFDIYVNRERPEVRQYFTLAHEIGHYFLHKDSLKSKGTVTDADSIFNGGILFREDNSLDGGLNTQQEAEANAFAASLLMPGYRVIESFEKIRDVQECAKLFKVSLIAMSVRLEKLNLVESNFKL